MKKLLSLILAVALLTALCATAFAATSKTWLVEVVNVEKATVEEVLIEDDAELEELQVEMEQAMEDSELTEEAGLSADVKLTVLAVRDIVVEEGETATMDIVVEGVKDLAIDVAVFMRPADGSAMQLLMIGELPMQMETATSGTLIVAHIG